MVLAAGTATQARAQSNTEPPVPEKAGKVFRALRIDGAPPRIDGRLDDAVWAVADSIDDLIQAEPDNMEPMSERTVTRVAYDDRYLYVAVYCYDSEPSKIAAGFGRRDRIPASDFIFIAFDPQHDHLTGYAYQTNASGVFGDIGLFDDERVNSDYDAVWEVRTVWNLSTFNGERRGEFNPYQDLRDAFRADGTHVFMVKVNYWLNL